MLRSWQRQLFSLDNNGGDDVDDDGDDRVHDDDDDDADHILRSIS